MEYIVAAIIMTILGVSWLALLYVLSVNMRRIYPRRFKSEHGPFVTTAEMTEFWKELLSPEKNVGGSYLLLIWAFRTVTVLILGFIVIWTLNP
jgi:hypothetical protein